MFLHKSLVLIGYEGIIYNHLKTSLLWNAQPPASRRHPISTPSRTTNRNRSGHLRGRNKDEDEIENRSHSSSDTSSGSEQTSSSDDELEHSAHQPTNGLLLNAQPPASRRHPISTPSRTTNRNRSGHLRGRNNAGSIQRRRKSPENSPVSTSVRGTSRGRSRSRGGRLHQSTPSSLSQNSLNRTIAVSATESDSPPYPVSGRTSSASSTGTSRKTSRRINNGADVGTNQRSQLVGNLVEVGALVWDFVDRLVEKFLLPLLEKILQKITTGVVRHKIPEPLDDQFREEGDLVEELAEVYQFVVSE
ncbi:Protein CBG08169 [Caenorhabditis briggsae]|uniref:Protein CBG08169 n=1 Tax=Caenorhabditis briggsae TaxID=6238 RepID=A8X5Z3_CAEBR|nr:Protein CBG08169 [Caenorhabditis briggsae]CAP28054.2 Protein CBG08169 [Caenorhabditis briggsae]